MKSYPCMRPRSVGQNSVVCQGIMTKVKQKQHPNKMLYVCDQCGREGWWWEIRSVPRGAS